MDLDFAEGIKYDLVSGWMGSGYWGNRPGSCLHASHQTQTVSITSPKLNRSFYMSCE